MNEEFNKYLKSGKLVSFPGGRGLINKELETAKNDLSDAKSSFENGHFKWATIQAYYAMFHAARALIYSKGYREKSHYAITIALKVLFVSENKLDMNYVRDLLNAMNLREAADYEADFS